MDNKEFIPMQIKIQYASVTTLPFPAASLDFDFESRFINKGITSTLNKSFASAELLGYIDNMDEKYHDIIERFTIRVLPKHIFDEGLNIALDGVIKRLKLYPGKFNTVQRRMLLQDCRAMPSDVRAAVSSICAYMKKYLNMFHVTINKVGDRLEIINGWLCKNKLFPTMYIEGVDICDLYIALIRESPQNTYGITDPELCYQELVWKKMKARMMEFAIDMVIHILIEHKWLTRILPNINEANLLSK